MTEDQAIAKIRAAGWLVASELGWREAVRLLEQIAREIEATQWPDRR